MNGYFCGTFPSSESMYPTGRDPQHNIISEDSMALAVHRDWGPQMLSAKDRNKQGQNTLLSKLMTHFTHLTVAKE